MKKFTALLIILTGLVICSCSQEENQTSKDFTGIYGGNVFRNNGYPPYGFSATVVNNTILTFKCSSSSGSVCFAPISNIKINDDGTFTMENTSTVYKGRITSDFQMLGTYVYSLGGSSISNNFSWSKN